MIEYIKTSFTKPTEIYTGRNMKNSHFFKILLTLVLSLTVLSLFEFYPAFIEMNEDITEVKEAIPGFTLTNDELESETESFIYQTDTLFLYFDPDNRISTDTIDRNINTLPVPLSVGILKENLYLNVLGQNFSIKYSDLTNFTTQDLIGLIDNIGQFSPSYLFLFVLFLFMFHFILYFTQFFPIVLFANIISVYRRTGLRFFQTMKIALLATIPPALILYVVNAFLFPVYYQFELLIVSSIIIYYLSITEMKKRIQKQNNSKT